MTDEQEKILLEFLRNVLYDPQKAHLDATAFPASDARVMEALQFVAQCAREQQAFGNELAAGDIDTEPPSVENGLAAPLKEMQGALRHLRWQICEIAKGDLVQRIDYMGDIGDAFNSMREKLKERQDELMEEREAITKQNRELDNMQNMITSMALDQSRFIVMTNEECTQVIFRTATAMEFHDEHFRLACELDKRLEECPKRVLRHPVSWEITHVSDQDAEGKYSHYTITSNRIRWQDSYAIAHMVVNDTEEIEQRRKMAQMAFSDVLTGLGNRHYAMQLIQQMQDTKPSFVVVFLDMDYLKYCNDEFGHEEGDRYLISFSELLQSIQKPREICRIGGDEFMVVKEDATAAEMVQQLEELRQKFMAEDVPTGYLFKRSFSYGMVEVKSKDGKTLSDILEEADRKMYDYKISHKKFLMRKH